MLIIKQYIIIPFRDIVKAERIIEHKHKFILFANHFPTRLSTSCCTVII